MGVQYTIVVAIFLIVANFGVSLDVYLREYLYLFFLALSALTGSIGGFMSGRLYKFFNGTKWKRHSALTIMAVPVFAISLLASMTIAEGMELNRFGVRKKTEFDKVYLVWALFDMPNVAIGCWLGYRADKFEVPVKPTRLGRSVPTLIQTPCYAQGWFTLSLGSILISGCVISEAYYLVTSLWRHHYYFMYVYLTICAIVMAYVASTVSVVQTYAVLSVGNYHWWWRSFILGFAVGVHVFAVCSYFFFFVETDSSFSLKLSYALWTIMLCTLTGLVAGACSFIGSWYFVKQIYTKAQAQKAK